MSNGMTCMIWCDECTGENWDDVRRWIHEGRGAARSGVLKVKAECRSCGAELPVGSSVEAITLHGGGAYASWEEEYIHPDGGRVGVTER